MTSVANRGCRGNKNHKRRADPLMVYDGQFCVGEIRDHGRGNVAAARIDQSGRRTAVGTYPTRTAAMKAIIRP